MFAPPGTSANHRVPPGEAGGVCGGAVSGELTPGITPPPPAIATPPEGASVPPPPAASIPPPPARDPPPPAPAAATAPVPPVAAAIVVSASAFDAAPRPQAMAAPQFCYRHCRASFPFSGATKDGTLYRRGSVSFTGSVS